MLRALGIRTVIDLRSGTELERGRFDVDAHPVAFHHFPFIEELPDAEEFDRRPGLLGSQYREMLRDAGRADPRRARGPRRPRRAAGRLPLHGRQGPHRRALRRRALAARRGRADGGGRLRAQRRGHGAPAGQAHREVPRQPGRRSRTSTRCSRPSRPRWSCCSTTCGSATARSTPTSRGSGPARAWSRACGPASARAGDLTSSSSTGRRGAGGRWHRRAPGRAA